MKLSTRAEAKSIVRRMKKIAKVRTNTELGGILGGIKSQSISSAVGRKIIPENWFEVFWDEFGVTKNEICDQANLKIPATITPGRERLNLVDQLPINKITPLKLIVEWMNETYRGEMGEVMAMQFYEDLKKNYPSFRAYIEKKEQGTNHLDGPPENISAQTG